jgi:hypothetical protein
MQHQLRVSDLILKEDWKKLQKDTASMRREARQILLDFTRASKAFEKEQASARRSIERHRSRANIFLERTKDPTLKRLIKKKFLKKGESFERYRRGIELMTNDHREPPHGISAFLVSGAFEFAIAVGYTGFWGGFHASYNRHFLRQSASRLAETKAKDFEGIIRIERRRIIKDLKKLYSLHTPYDSKDLQTCLDILARQESSLKKLPEHVRPFPIGRCPYSNLNIIKKQESTVQ